ncbi:hypothetical protein BDN70DRAFT_902333 [Pholiota conissans]|uniref:Uncharacterized protein n=1 Tax=Pholiota conissans TaxID=109636 RepID=A0A9P6CRL1_9AGAR|nr:hypothetical protein BDN70DRAFT_902333 [Pholiota conissans]
MSVRDWATWARCCGNGDSRGREMGAGGSGADGGDVVGEGGGGDVADEDGGGEPSHRWSITAILLDQGELTKRVLYLEMNVKHVSDDDDEDHIWTILRTTNILSLSLEARVHPQGTHFIVVVAVGSDFVPA